LRRIAAIAIAVAALTAGASAAGTPAPRPVKLKCGAFTPTAGMRPLWLRTSDGVRLYAAEAGRGRTAVVLAHESPADLCGWLRFVPSLEHAGLRVLAFDFRGFGDSGPGIGRGALAYDRDVRAAIAHVRREGARKVVLVGASFGGAVALADGAALGVDGIVSLSGEPRLANSGLDGIADVRRLHVPLLVVASSADHWCTAADARAIVRAAGSRDKRAIVYTGAWHGWDILDLSTYAARARAAVVGWIRAHAS
jgi:alpha-beta hydrolase superfamily lysophospholipase